MCVSPVECSRSRALLLCRRRREVKFGGCGKSIYCMRDAAGLAWCEGASCSSQETV